MPRSQAGGCARRRLRRGSVTIRGIWYYPPGTSKRNKIEHRLFCHINRNWRGKPPVSRATVVELIAATTTKTGLTVQCELDQTSYAKAVKVADAEMAALNITTNAWRPEWNYTISPAKNTAVIVA